MHISLCMRYSICARTLRMTSGLLCNFFCVVVGVRKANATILWRSPNPGGLRIQPHLPWEMVCTTRSRSDMSAQSRSCSRSANARWRTRQLFAGRSVRTYSEFARYFARMPSARARASLSSQGVRVGWGGVGWGGVGWDGMGEREDEVLVRV